MVGSGSKVFRGRGVGGMRCCYGFGRWGMVGGALVEIRFIGPGGNSDGGLGSIGGNDLNGYNMGGVGEWVGWEGVYCDFGDAWVAGVYIYDPCILCYYLCRMQGKMIQFNCIFNFISKRMNSLNKLISIYKPLYSVFGFLLKF